MKKILRILILIPLCGLLVFAGIFLALALYYRNSFPVNTWINGIYCTGKSIEQVNSELLAQTALPVLIIEESDGTQWEINFQDVDGSMDYTQALKAYLRQNSSHLWMQNLDIPVSVTVDQVQYKWNHDKLQTQFSKLAFVQKADLSREGVRVEHTSENGYMLYDGNTQRLDTQKALRYMESCLIAGQTHVKLAEGECYKDLEDNGQDKEQRMLWNQLEEIFSCNLVYDMGAEQIPLTSGIISRFLTVDGDLISVNKEGISAWVAELAESYNTAGTTRDFQSTRGDVVQVKYGTYGTELDTKSEEQWLLENVWENRQVRSQPEYHIPAYKKEAYARGMDDIGDTYIEIDMTEQRMYYYAEGELAFESDVVTGNTQKKMGTPEGIYYVYNKQKNRVLRGPGYASPVKFWMPVKGGVGIHDADWRKEYGGEIYKTNGSRGCINTPKDLMPELYEMVEIGTPVVMFY